MPGAPAYLQDLMERCVAKAGRSKQIAAESREHLTAPALRGMFRMPTKEALFLLTLTRGEGSRVWDIDGNEYLDVLMSFGVDLFGHDPPFIREALREQLERGIQLGGQDPLSPGVARSICELTGTERVYFCNSGTEAVMSAIRLSRATTGRDKVAIFRGSYHGFGDGVLMDPSDDGTHGVPWTRGIPPAVGADVVVLDYLDDGALEAVAKLGSSLAAVVVEPMQNAAIELRPAEFLRRLRAVTQEHGILLVFDEVFTGFRLALGGAQELFDVRADLITYGKILGGGMPIGVVAGKAELMDAVDGGRWSYGDFSVPMTPTTFLAGTYSKHPMAMAAARAVLDHLAAAGPGLQEELNRRTDRVVTTLAAELDARELPFQVVSCASVLSILPKRPLGSLDVPGPPIRPMQLLGLELQTRGVYQKGGNFILSTAHTDADLEVFQQALLDSLTALASQIS